MKILIIEDEKDLREVMTRSLEKERFVVETAADYSTALQKINDYDYDCILLDIMLPGGSGLSILEELKKLKKRESVIIVSAKDSIEDKVTGLDLGADDYLLAELHARVKSVIRRHQTDGNTEIEIENLTVRPDDHTVFINGEELKLNRKEFDLLYYFVTNPNRLINKTTLAESVWGDNIDQGDLFEEWNKFNAYPSLPQEEIDTLYCNLRKKMKTADAIPEIKAVYGFGYKLITTPEA